MRSVHQLQLHLLGVVPLLLVDDQLPLLTLEDVEGMTKSGGG